MNLPKVLQDLRAEKRWLETMIGALEIASRSPADRSAGALVNSLQNRGADLHRKKKAELARLAAAVKRAALKEPNGDRHSPSGSKVIPVRPKTIVE
jgi:hypothetical protein